MKKITKKEINKENMVALSYCQCQTILDLFAYDYKVGYNAGIYGWNYDLYVINGISIVTGYNVPYCQYCNKELKNKLINLENEVRETKYNFGDYEKFKKEFLEIFE